MKYYIVDDNLATVKTLKHILESRELGTVSGFATDPIDAIEDILAAPVDIVLVDFLMEGIDGITLVERIRAKNDSIAFVMISKVTDKEMVQRAYTAGIEFFINKPVNIVEVERVLTKVSENIKMRGIMDNIKGMFSEPARDEPEQKKAALPDGDIDIIFGALGMLGDKGTQDIRNIFNELLSSGNGYNRELLERVASKSNDTVKNIEQRVRRAIKKGLSNAATIGLHDFSNESFSVYADYVFDFKTLKDEMNYIEGKSSTGGRVNIAGFMEGLLLYVNSR